MNRCTLLALLATVCLMGSGCRNGCGPLGTPWLANQSRIAPPATYSLNIPSRGAAGAPYYTPGNVAPIDAAATTAANHWQLQGNGTTAGTAPTSVLTENVQSTSNQLVVNASDYQIRGGAVSDPSRLPVTDATGIRAPSSNLNTATSRTMAQTYATQAAPYGGLQRVVGNSTIVPAQPTRVAGLPVINGTTNQGTVTPTGWRAPERSTERFQ